MAFWLLCSLLCSSHAFLVADWSPPTETPSCNKPPIHHAVDFAHNTMDDLHTTAVKETSSRAWTLRDDSLIRHIIILRDSLFKTAVKAYHVLSLHRTQPTPRTWSWLPETGKSMFYQPTVAW